MRKIGQGGMGQVYLATDERSNADSKAVVAIKVIRLSGTSEKRYSQILRNRFEQEVSAQIRADHPGIAQALDYGDSDGKPYFVQAYIPGRSLSSVIDEAIALDDWSTLTPQFALDVAAKLLETIQFLHLKGVYHRDIKPDNIMLQDQGGTTDPKLIDFGLARAVTAGLAFGETVAGTPGYAGPEQFLRPEQSDSRSDIHAVSALLYTMLGRGAWPYSEALSQEPTTRSFYQKIVTGDIRLKSLADYNLNLRRDLVEAVEKGLSPLTIDRYQSADEMRKVLDRYVSSYVERYPEAAIWLLENNHKVGTAFAVSANTLLTSAGLLRDRAGAWAELCYLYQTGQPRRIARVELVDANRDIAVLRVEDTDIEFALELSDGDFDRTDPGWRDVAIVGYCGGGSFKDDVVECIPRWVCARLLIHESLETELGKSDATWDTTSCGGPVFDEHGRVLGLLGERSPGAEGVVLVSGLDPKFLEQDSTLITRAHSAKYRPAPSRREALALSHLISGRRELQSNDLVKAARHFDQVRYHNTSECLANVAAIGLLSVHLARPEGLSDVDMMKELVPVSASLPRGDLDVHRVLVSISADQWRAVIEGLKQDCNASSRMHSRMQSWREFAVAAVGHIGSLVAEEVENAKIDYLTQLLLWNGECRLALTWWHGLYHQTPRASPSPELLAAACIMSGHQKLPMAWDLIRAAPRSSYSSLLWTIVLSGLGRHREALQLTMDPAAQNQTDLFPGVSMHTWHARAVSLAAEGHYENSFQAIATAIERRQELAAWCHSFQGALPSTTALVVEWGYCLFRIIRDLGDIETAGQLQAMLDHSEPDLTAPNEDRSEIQVLSADVSSFVSSRTPSDALQPAIAQLQASIDTSSGYNARRLSLRYASLLLQSGFPQRALSVSLKLLHTRSIQRITLSWFAGSGVAGRSDGYGMHASFNSPQGIAAGRDGTLYIADTHNHLVRGVRADSVWTVAGSGEEGRGDGKALEASFCYPTGVAVGIDGAIYVADSGTRLVRVIRDGWVKTLTSLPAQNGVDSAGQVLRWRACDLAYGGNNALYIADGATLLELRLSTLDLSTFFDFGPNRRESVDSGIYVSGVSWDKGGGLLMACLEQGPDSAGPSRWIAKVERSGTAAIQEVFPVAGIQQSDVRADDVCESVDCALTAPSGIAVSGDGHAYSADTDGTLWAERGGQFVAVASIAPSQALRQGRFSLAIGAGDAVYVTDPIRHGVWKMCEEEQDSKLTLMLIHRCLKEIASCDQDAIDAIISAMAQTSY